MTMQVSSIDHIVITVHDIDKTIAFYTRVLGMEPVSFAEGRKALVFGAQKINLHKFGEEIKPNAGNPLPGSVDICFLTDTPIQQVISHLDACDVAIIDGPTEKKGAGGPLLSIYIRDPEGNLIEIANRLND